MDITVDIDDYKLNVRSSAIIIHNNKVLLHRNIKSDHYALIGGRVEIGEDSEKTIIREILEETGKKIQITGYVTTLENFFEMKQSKYHEILFIYKAEFLDNNDREIEYTIKNIEGKDYIQYEWIDLNKIDEYPIKPEAIKNILKEKVFPAHKINDDLKFIYKITDKDIGEEKVNMENPKLRFGARGIVFREEDGKIAVFNKSNLNQYKLPGGGIEGEEKPEEAFKREVLEETGCRVEIVDYLGRIEECRSLSNFKQISHVFVGKIIEDTGELHLTEKEKQEGAILLWKEPKEALELIRSCYNKLFTSHEESAYHEKIIVLRDKKILEHYLNEIEKK